MFLFKTKKYLFTFLFLVSAQITIFFGIYLNQITENRILDFKKFGFNTDKPEAHNELVLGTVFENDGKNDILSFWFKNKTKRKFPEKTSFFQFFFNYRKMFINYVFKVKKCTKCFEENVV